MKKVLVRGFIIDITLYEYGFTEMLTCVFEAGIQHNVY